MKYPEFRALEDRNGGSKADDLLTASITAFSSVARPTRSDAQQLEDLAVPLLALVSPRVRRHAAAILSELPHAPRRLIQTLAREDVDISAPLLLRSAALSTGDLIEIIHEKGIAHARAVARRSALEPELVEILRAMRDSAIDRSLALASEAEPHEEADTGSGESERLRQARAALKALVQAGQPAGSGAASLADRLIDAALLDQTDRFHREFAEALDLDAESVAGIVGHGLNAELTIALAALGLSAEAAHLVLTGLFGLVHEDLNSLRLFVHSYRQIDREKAQSTVLRWKTREHSRKLRQKLQEMAAADERRIS